MSYEQILFLFPIVAGMVFSNATQAVAFEKPLVFISAFAPGEKGAIHAFELNPLTGELKLVERTTDVEHPFFLAVSPDNKFLYSIHAPGKFGGKENEFVAAYELQDRTGKLKLLNRQSSLGTASCYLDIDKSGKAVVVANYSTGSVASLPVKEDGSLGEAATFIQHTGSSVDPARQKEPHAHCSVISPDQKFMFAADLGLDKILAYDLDSKTAKLTPSQQSFVRTIPGAGPRHLTFHPDGKHLYAINELKNSVTEFEYDPKTGTLIEQDTISTLPADFEGTSHCADLKIAPDGRFLYGTNRGHDSIAAYKIDDTGKLTLIGIEPSLGKGPQNLAITANGKFLLCANMPGNNVIVFSIDETTGKLTPVGNPIEMPSPSCIMIR
ncbi:lactonase family protein [uncultured Gimesia sp.]|jgi:6-phosphogluconolactonase|uniref:lactonase family protein n=1 Tax=uncultured Gimesia sp. TaxID=1678688 RepID=UPI00261791E6|nr:lactonase family protein [uncultured Gimesia sp.]